MVDIIAGGFDLDVCVALLLPSGMILASLGRTLRYAAVATTDDLKAGFRVARDFT